MSDSTSTTPSASGDAGTDFQAKYNGLQAAFQRRQNEFAQLQAEHAKAMAELEGYRVQGQAQREEQAALEQYEQLRDRFEPEPPTPISTSPARGTGGRDDGSPEWARQQMRKQAGFEPPRTGWV